MFKNSGFKIVNIPLIVTNCKANPSYRSKITKDVLKCDIDSFKENFMSNKKYTILCYIINDYEDVHEILEKDDQCEYLLITDNPNLQSKTWTVIYDTTLIGLSTFDKCYSIRFNLFKYATTDICVYIDANIQVKKPLTKLIDIFNNGQYDMCLMPHPLNCQFIPEYKNWINWRKYPVENANKFIKMLNMSNYNYEYKSLFQGCFKIVRRGKLNSDFENLTMAFLKYLGKENEIERLDQTVYSYVLNNYFSDIKVLPVSEQIVRSDYMAWFWHKSNKLNLNAFYDITKPDIKFVFNEKVKCLYLN